MRRLPVTACLVISGFLVSGCGATRLPEPGGPAATARSAEVRDRPRLVLGAVVLAGGTERFEALAPYVAMRAARSIESGGRYRATDPAMDAQVATQLGIAVRAESGFLLELEVRAVDTSTATALRLGPLYSSAGLRHTVRVAGRLVDERGHSGPWEEAEGSADKRAVAHGLRVDAGKLARRDGFWRLEGSTLGVAAGEAVELLLTKMALVNPP